MPRYLYPGDGPALERALASNGLPPGSGNRVRALMPFKVITSLVSQACHGTPTHAPGIVAEAEKQLAVLYAAVEAAETVLADARAGLGMTKTAAAEV